jgi:hypothetical protein
MAEAIFGQNSRLSMSASTVLHLGTWNKPQRRAARRFFNAFYGRGDRRSGPSGLNPTEGLYYFIGTYSSKPEECSGEIAFA